MTGIITEPAIADAPRRRHNHQHTVGGNFWSDENIATLLRLWREGHSASLISRELRISRNAVVAKLHRLGEPERPTRHQLPNPMKDPAVVERCMAAQGRATKAKPSPVKSKSFDGPTNVSRLFSALGGAFRHLLHRPLRVSQEHLRYL